MSCVCTEAELNKNALSFMCCVKQQISQDRPQIWEKKLMVFKFNFFWMIFSLAPLSTKCEIAKTWGHDRRLSFCERILEGQAAHGPGQTHLQWRRSTEAVVQQSFIVRMDCTRFFDAKWNMTQNLYRTEALSGTQPAEAWTPAYLLTREATNFGCVNFFLSRRAKFELSRVISPQCHKKCSNVEK